MSAIDICNRALSDIGTRSTIASFNEGSAESEACALWYDPLRKMLLRAAPWGFARAQEPLSTLGTAAAGTSIYPWPFKYAHPSDALRIRYLLPPTPTGQDQSLFTAYGMNLGPDRGNRFVIAYAKNPLGQPIKVILGTLLDAQAVYIVDVEDTSLFDPSFDLALSAMLSYKLVIPLSGNVGQKEAFRAMADSMVTSARVADGNEAIPTTDHTPDWILARGDGVGFPSPWANLGNWYVGFDNLDWGA